jgi:hypothetical protein
MNRIDALTPTEYRETPVARVTLPGTVGTHCWDRDDAIEVVDVITRIPRRRVWASR